MTTLGADLAPGYRPGTHGLVATYLDRHSPATTAAYAGDLADFADFSAVARQHPVSNAHGAFELLAHGPGLANALALAYRRSLEVRGLAAATVNRRLAALQSLVKLARTIGYEPEPGKPVTWTLEVARLRPEPRRDMRGPEPAIFRKMVAELGLPSTPGVAQQAAQRDRALICLTAVLGLRRATVAALDLSDYDRARSELAVGGKGRRETTRRTLPPEVVREVDLWLVRRGEGPGPLFVRLDRRAWGGRLSPHAVGAIVGRAGRRVGVTVRAHGLRHTSGTSALAAGYDVAKVAKHLGHSGLGQVLTYADQLDDSAGKVAASVSTELLGEDPKP